MPGRGQCEVGVPGRGQCEVGVPGRGQCEVGVPGRGQCEVGVPGRGQCEVGVPGRGRIRATENILRLQRFQTLFCLSKKGSNISNPPSSNQALRNVSHISTQWNIACTNKYMNCVI